VLFRSEPITLEYVTEIIKKEKPDAILPTVGGQTALNLAIELYEQDVLKKYKVELLGAQINSIQKAEDREKFKEAMDEVSIETARGNFVYSWHEAKALISKIQFPIIIRPSFTMALLQKTSLRFLPFSANFHHYFVPHWMVNFFSRTTSEIMPAWQCLDTIASFTTRR
jgi:hypothetical protein